MYVRVSDQLICLIVLALQIEKMKTVQELKAVAKKHR